MSGYREDRRTDPIPPLPAVTRNEAGTLSDIDRQRAYEKARDALADERRRQLEGDKRRKFSDLVKKKP